MKNIFAIATLVLLVIFLCFKMVERNKMREMNDTLSDAFAHQPNQPGHHDEFTDTFFIIISDFPERIRVIGSNYTKYGLYDYKHEKAITKRIYDQIDCSGGGNLVNFKRNEKYGFLDTLGNEVIPATYDAANAFTEGLVSVKQNDKWGYINLQNKFVIKPMYESADNFYADRASVKLNGRWGFINKKNELIIPPKYESAFDFYEDRAAVQINNRWGFVNRSGRFAIKPIYDEVVWAFRNDRPHAKVRIDSRYILIDRNGKFVGNTNDSYFNEK